jgi:hypothetical protein
MTNALPPAIKCGGTGSGNAHDLIKVLPALSTVGDFFSGGGCAAPSGELLSKTLPRESSSPNADRLAASDQ